MHVWQKDAELGLVVPNTLEVVSVLTPPPPPAEKVTFVTARCFCGMVAKMLLPGGT